MNWLTLHGSYKRTKYEGLSEKTLGGLHEYIFKNLPLNTLPTGSSILDLGGGSGAWAVRLSDNGYRVTVCDINCQQSNFPCYSVNLNEEFAESFGNSQFDCITCIEVLEHLENPRNALRQNLKLLSDGGLLILSTPNVSGLYSRIRFLFTGKFSQFDDRHYSQIGHIRPITYWEIIKMLEECEFKVLKNLFHDATPLIPRTIGDIVKKISWFIRPFLLGTIGTQTMILIAQKKENESQQL